jgi:hypothetical protein
MIEAISVRYSFSFQRRKSICFTLIIMSVFAFLMSSCQDPAPTNEELFEQYFTPFVNAIQPVNGDEVSEDLTTRAFVAYETKDYIKAENLFFKIYRTEKKSFALFYAAMSQMAQGKTKESRTLLKVYLNYPNDSFTTQAHWYMALGYLKEAKREDAIRKLKNIIADHADYKLKAEELLEKLERP